MKNEMCKKTDNRLKSKKGTMMVEAAVILPLVILSVITIVYLLMFTYEEVASQSELHMRLRNAAGESASIHYSESKECSSIAVSEIATLKGKALTASVEVESTPVGLVTEKRRNEISGQCLVINEENCIRMLEGGKDVISKLLESGRVQ